VEAQLDHYVLVPDGSRRAVLVVRGAARNELPRATGGTGAAGTLDALADAYGLRAPYLRPALVLFDETRTPTGVLREFDAPPPDWDPPTGLAWLDLEHAEPEALAPIELAAQISRWIEEQLGEPIPPERPPWARPGWLAEATCWIGENVTALGLESRGEVELVAQWPLSSVLKLDTDGGVVFFKAVFPLFHHEPVLTSKLSARHPGLVPDVLAIEGARGWMLMRELPGTPIGDQAANLWSEGLRVAASIQKMWIGRDEELLSLGVHDRTLQALEHDLATTLARIELSPEDQARFKASLPTFARASAELGAGAVPETLVHGDLHPGNVMRAGDEVRVFDWSDSCVSYPFFDLSTYFERTEDEQVRAALFDAYLEAWSDTAPMGELRALAQCAQPLATAHLAISYARILDAVEPSDRWWFEDEPGRRLRLALDGAEALRQSWDDL
jgi:hypothetical protein